MTYLAIAKPPGAVDSPESSAPRINRNQLDSRTPFYSHGLAKHPEPQSPSRRDARIVRLLTDRVLRQ